MKAALQSNQFYLFFNIFNIIISVGRGSNTDFQLSQTIIQRIPCATW